jgi:hypothetical protein
VVDTVPELPVLPPPVQPSEPPPPVKPRVAEALPVKSAAPPPRPPADPPLVEAIRCFLSSHPDDQTWDTALKHLQSYDKPTQDVLLSLLALAGLLAQESVERLSPAEMSQVVEDLSNLVGQMRTRSPLIIDKMAFCRRIERFGVYDPLPGEHVFRPGELVQVYLELRHFTTAQQGPFFVTRISSRLEVLDFQKLVVYFREDQVGGDLSRTPRQDFFANFHFPIPPNMPPGKYTLCIQVQDAGKAGQPPVRRSLDFRVGLPLRSAAPN